VRSGHLLVLIGPRHWLSASPTRHRG